MSLTAALSNAASGLSAVTRAAELVSSNVANATTDGYGRKEIEYAANVTGGAGAGVQVASVNRVVNQPAINDRRLAEAELGAAQTEISFFESLETVLGTVDDPTSLTGRIADFEAKLTVATASPENEVQLGLTVSAAKGIAGLINRASDEVQALRVNADSTIASQVRTLNSALSGVSDINKQIQALSVAGGDATGLMDQRQRLIDDIGELIPIRELPRDFGVVALATPNGTLLVESDAATFEFTSTPTIVPDMTVQSGAVSGLTIVGASSSAGTPLEAIAGGALAANFAIRDTIAPSAQAELDSVARNLIERVSDATVDPTIGTGPGLFTDGGAAFVPADELGLAGRITLNFAVDPATGGSVTRLRDGVGAVATGPEGNRSILTALSNVMSGKSADGTTTIQPEFATKASDLVSGFSSERINAQSSVAFFQTQFDAFSRAEASGGVDTDQEMQKLLLIEQSYAANAKIIQAIDEMLQSLIRI
jgi:flagellar hook-associated protein 1 FlgK